MKYVIPFSLPVDTQKANLLICMLGLLMIASKENALCILLHIYLFGI